MQLPCLVWRCSIPAANAAARNRTRLLRKSIQRKKQTLPLPSTRLLHLVHLQRAANYQAIPTSSVSPDTHSSAWLTRPDEASDSKKAKLTEEDEDEWAVNPSVRSSRSSGTDPAKAKGETLEKAPKSFPQEKGGTQSSPEGTSLNTTSRLSDSEVNSNSGSDRTTKTPADDVSHVTLKSDSALFPSKSATGLDLSSSLLIQQMLFSKNEPVETTAPPTPEGQTSSLPLEPVSTEIPTSIAPESQLPPASSTPTNSEDPNAASDIPISIEPDLSQKLDIRVGKILSVEHHWNAESLYVEQVDVGDGMECSTDDPAIPRSRTIVSGLVKYFDKDGLKDRNVVVVRNMKPTKLRGVVSEGMLLCAEHEGKVELLEPPKQSLPGERVYFEGLENADDDSTLSVLNAKRKIFETVAQDFSTNSLGVALYKGKYPFRTRHGLVTVKSIREGGKIR